MAGSIKKAVHTNVLNKIFKHLFDKSAQVRAIGVEEVRGPLARDSWPIVCIAYCVVRTEYCVSTKVR